MPSGDRTGPAGEGPRSGRGAGHCSGFAVPGNDNRDFGSQLYGGGRGRGSGFGGGGRGRRRWFPPTTGWTSGQPSATTAPLSSAVSSSPKAEKRVLQRQVSLLENQLDGIRKRLDELAGKETPRD